MPDMRLVVNNTPQPAPPEPPSDAELRAGAQGALVKAAKHSPLRVIVIADLGDGETGVWTSGLSRADARTLAGTGVRAMLEGMP